jgi:hypothetical protein
MYDALTTSYRFACPVRGETRVRLSSFRYLQRLPGPAHPSVYSVRFACPCGDDHQTLVAHGDLDWAPLGLGEGEFVNLMTDKTEPVAADLVDLAARHIGDGDWPWSFYCFAEDRPRPIFPSSFVVLAPATTRRLLALAVGTSICRFTTTARSRSCRTCSRSTSSARSRRSVRSFTQIRSIFGGFSSTDAHSRQG